MSITQKKPYIFIAKMTLLAFIVSALPLPEIILDIAPFWMLLVFIYWVTHFTAKGRFFIALVIGVLLDVLHGDLLGQNALALILSGVFISSVKQSFSVSNVTTQQIYVLGASFIYLSLLLAVHSLSIQSFSFNYFLIFKPFLGALLWPIVQLSLSKIRH